MMICIHGTRMRIALQQKVAGKKSLINSDPIQRRPPARCEHARLPQGFFDDAPDNVHASSTHRSLALSLSSTSRTHEFLGRFSSLFHRPHPTTGESSELQQSQRQHMTSHPGPHAVEVAPVRDKQALYVAPRQEPVSERAKHIKNPTWWTRCILFICCVSVPSTDTNGHG
ncbi:hypothetical protein K503DRAFT_620527 [Rhizopogon vinicolor AM-OR11-026]|uniref:Uncharacterized protein n=1 Tax=Rhizopogon vinicolor AM-OR11-026 TaxID=1314800 RepID=A0A1B7N6E1_9AGAM|nr:hypothetical protein K503DRAFT_620527 [Rhizopogon vinicolor AM-OR11-026]